MNILTPVERIMTTELITLNPEDSALRVKQLLDKHNIHHVLVVEYKKLVGIVSDSDLLSYLTKEEMGADSTKKRLENTKVRDIMTTKLAKINRDDALRTVISVFCLNRFHALPVVEGEDLIGIITTFDIIALLDSEKIKLEDYQQI